MLGTIFPKLIVIRNHFHFQFYFFVKQSCPKENRVLIGYYRPRYAMKVYNFLSENLCHLLRWEGMLDANKMRAYFVNMSTTTNIQSTPSTLGMPTKKIHTNLFPNLLWNQQWGEKTSGGFCVNLFSLISLSSCTSCHKVCHMPYHARQIHVGGKSTISLFGSHKATARRNVKLCLYSLDTWRIWRHNQLTL